MYIHVLLLACSLWPISLIVSLAHKTASGTIILGVHLECKEPHGSEVHENYS